MRLALLGKPGGITHWLEDIADDLRLAGDIVAILPTRDTRLSKSVEHLLLSPAIGAPLAMRLLRQLRRLAPDLLVAAGKFAEFPTAIMQRVAAMPGRPPLVAWIGDVFSAADRDMAGLFDLVAYTDTGMLALHDQLGFRSPRAFVPLGASRAVAAVTVPARVPELAFVAAPTPGRRALLAAIRQPVALFGPGWQDAPELAQHRRDARRIDPDELARIYAGHLGVLNIRHEIYVLNGLNQRHFAPYVHATPVISDAVADIAQCFDPGSEMLVYRDAAELEAIYRELRAHPARAAAIGAAGQRRVLAEHTYQHRLGRLRSLVGLPAQ